MVFKPILIGDGFLVVRMDGSSTDAVFLSEAQAVERMGELQGEDYGNASPRYSPSAWTVRKVAVYGGIRQDDARGKVGDIPQAEK